MTAKENATARSDVVPKRLTCSQVPDTHSYRLLSRKKYCVILGEHNELSTEKQLSSDETWGSSKPNKSSKGGGKNSKHICTGCTTRLCVVSKVKQLLKNFGEPDDGNTHQGLAEGQDVREHIPYETCAWNGGDAASHDTAAKHHHPPPDSPHPHTTLISSPLPSFIRANNSATDSTAEWNIHGRDEADAAERLCTFLYAVCTDGTFWAGKVFRAGCLCWWCAPEEEEKSVD